MRRMTALAGRATQQRKAGVDVAAGVPPVDPLLAASPYAFAEAEPDATANRRLTKLEVPLPAPWSPTGNVMKSPPRPRKGNAGTRRTKPAPRDANGIEALDRDVAPWLERLARLRGTLKRITAAGRACAEATTTDRAPRPSPSITTPRFCPRP